MSIDPPRRADSGHWAHGEDNGGTTTTYVPATHPEQDEHPAVDHADYSGLVPPDLTGECWRHSDQDGAIRYDDRGAVTVAALTGILAAAVATGVATFAAAFVRPQASPASAVGGVLFARIPAPLRHFMAVFFGVYSQAVLLLTAIGLVAAVSGVLARRNLNLAAVGIAAFGLLAAFITITRPQGRASDVVPSAVGAVAGIMAQVWLVRASAPDAG